MTILKNDSHKHLIAPLCLLFSITLALALRLKHASNTLIGPNSYYHLRNIQYIIDNHNILRFDSLTNYPTGLSQPFAPLYDILVAALASIFGLNIIYYLPIVFLIITILLTYLIGRELYGDAAGLIAAIILVTIPGTFFISSLVGANDGRIFETMLYALSFYLAIKTLKTKSPRYYSLTGIAMCACMYAGGLIHAPATGTNLKSIFVADDNLFWANFGFTGCIMMLCLGTLFIKKLSGMRFFVVFWTALSFGAAIFQSKYACFLAINTAVLAAYAIVMLCEYLQQRVKSQYINTIFIIILIAVMINTNISLINEQVNRTETVSEPWMETLQWMQKNTPVESYGVLSSGEYGNYIQVVGERAPVASPYVICNISTEFFAARSEDEAIRALRGSHVKYIITDIPMATDDFSDVTGLKPANFSENITFVGDVKSKSSNVTVYMPNDTYYNSMLMKLHLLDGEGLRHFRLIYESSSSRDIREIELKRMYNARYNTNLSGFSGDVKVFEVIDVKV